MALLQNKPCHFYGRQTICLQAKFELSRWTLSPLVPIFLFRSLNKLGPLVAYPKTAMMVPAYMGQDQSTPVSSQSINLKGNFVYRKWRTVDNPICSCTSLAYVVRSPTLKRKSGCPTGIKKAKTMLPPDFLVEFWNNVQKGLVYSVTFVLLTLFIGLVHKRTWDGYRVLFYSKQFWINGFVYTLYSMHR